MAYGSAALPWGQPDPRRLQSPLGVPRAGLGHGRMATRID